MVAARFISSDRDAFQSANNYTDCCAASPTARYSRMMPMIVTVIKRRSPPRKIHAVPFFAGEACIRPHYDTRGPLVKQIRKPRTLREIRF